LAHKIGSADATLSRIERGKFGPSQAMLEGLASAIGCSVKDFFEPASAASSRKAIRPSQAKLLALTSEMTDAEVDDVVRAIRTLVRVGRRTSARV
jgi:transcriptional regulator with XRE-family HTH domain